MLRGRQVIRRVIRVKSSFRSRGVVLAVPPLAVLPHHSPLACLHEADDATISVSPNMYVIQNVNECNSSILRSRSWKTHRWRTSQPHTLAVSLRLFFFLFCMHGPSVAQVCVRALCSFVACVSCVHSNISKVRSGASPPQPTPTHIRPYLRLLNRLSYSKTLAQACPFAHLSFL
jgi:hypothetical protein